MAEAVDVITIGSDSEDEDLMARLGPRLTTKGQQPADAASLPQPGRLKSLPPHQGYEQVIGLAESQVCGLRVWQMCPFVSCWDCRLHPLNLSPDS